MRKADRIICLIALSEPGLSRLRDYQNLANQIQKI